MAVVARHGDRGPVFVDVGANIRTTTLTALAAVLYERALSLKPDADNARVLRANIALNGAQGPSP